MNNYPSPFASFRRFCALIRLALYSQTATEVMKKKKHPTDLMEEDLMETIQQRIDERNAELKLLDEQHGKLFVPYRTILSRLRCKLDLLDLEHEQGRLRREQERRGREEQERREHEARENLLEQSKLQGYNCLLYTSPSPRD